MTTTSELSPRRGIADDVRCESHPIAAAELIATKKLLGWTSVRLASLLGTNYTTLQRFLSGRTLTRPFDPINVRLALETVGVEFIEDSGGGTRVRLRKS
jgi:hypothetical protein